MIELQRSSGQYPRQLSLDGVVFDNPHEAEVYSSAADVYTGSHRSQAVAIKKLKRPGGRGKVTDSRMQVLDWYFCSFHFAQYVCLQRFIAETMFWPHLRHPHVLPFLGIDQNTLKNAPCLITPWMEHGSLLDVLLAGTGNGANQRAWVVERCFSWVRKPSLIPRGSLMEYC